MVRLDGGGGEGGAGFEAGEDADVIEAVDLVRGGGDAVVINPADEEGGVVIPWGGEGESAAGEGNSLSVATAVRV